MAVPKTHLHSLIAMNMQFLTSKTAQPPNTTASLPVHLPQLFLVDHGETRQVKLNTGSAKVILGRLGCLVLVRNDSKS